MIPRYALSQNTKRKNTVFPKREDLPGDESHCEILLLNEFRVGYIRNLYDRDISGFTFENIRACICSTFVMRQLLNTIRSN
jgi:hypothetical protein